MHQASLTSHKLSRGRLAVICWLLRLRPSPPPTGKHATNVAAVLEPVPKPAAAPVEKPAAKPAAAPVPAAKPAHAPKVLSGFRNCVHSRAYKKAAKIAREAGLCKQKVGKAACKAGREAAEQWDKDHA